MPTSTVPRRTRISASCSSSRQLLKLVQRLRPSESWQLYTCVDSGGIHEALASGCCTVTD